jgi:cytochrome oxidase Cu insertion factor (SCO1/SenC/PrrC family)
MPRNLRMAAVAVAVVGALSGGVRAQQQQTTTTTPAQPELKVGDQAPDFTLQASDGQTYSLAKLKGKTVVLAWFPKAFTAG